MAIDKHSGQTALESMAKALDPDLTDGELATLSRSDEAKIRAVVAARAETPLTTLLKLATDAAPSVRAGVARNQRPEVPEDLFDQLSRDKSAEVIYALIENPTVPDGIIGRLARQYHKEYSGAARSRLSSKGGASKVLGQLGIS